MATPLIDRLGKELDAISCAYDDGYANQSRATRDLEPLDALIGRIRGVIRDVEQVPEAVRGPALDEVRDAANEMLQLYETERKAIDQARKLGPAFDDFARAATLANFVFARYLRHFAGQDRVTRDTGLLAEMVDDLKQIGRTMDEIAEEAPSEPVERDRKVVGRALDQYQKEIREIEKAQAALEGEEAAGLFGLLANEQFELYQTHFAGKSRLTRRPQLLKRMVDNLRRVEKRMKELGKVGDDDFNGKNLAIVAERVELYEKELGEIRSARQTTPIADIMGMLGGAANDLFEEYRDNFADKSRDAVDIALLGRLCDGLGEIARQMTEFAFAEHNETNEQNIDIVFQQLALFEQEYAAVREVQGNAAAGATKH